MIGIGQTEQTLATIGQTKQTWRPLARLTRHCPDHWADRTDPRPEIWVLARPKRPKYGYWPDRTDRNMGIRQTEQAKVAIGQTEGAIQIFSRPLWTVAPDLPVRDPSRSGQYLSWVADFILGILQRKSKEKFWHSRGDN